MMAQMRRLEGKVAIVTGAGQGIGRGIVHRYAKEGARIVIAEWKAHRGERTKGELEELGAEAISVPTDISDKRQIQALVEGGVDIIMIETIFDTLNAKAAIFALSQENDRHADPIGDQIPDLRLYPIGRFVYFQCRIFKHRDIQGVRFSQVVRSFRGR